MEENNSNSNEEKKYSKKDYLKLVKFVYGSNLANEIANDVDENSKNFIQDFEEITRKAIVKSRYLKYNPKKKLTDKQKKDKKQKRKNEKVARKVMYKNRK